MNRFYSGLLAISVGAGVVAHLSTDEDEDNVFAAKPPPKNDEPTLRPAVRSPNLSHKLNEQREYMNQHQRYSAAIVKINESYLDDAKTGETTF